MKWGHDHLRDGFVELGSCVREPVARETSQRSKDGESDGLTADFSVRRWERNRDLSF